MQLRMPNAEIYVPDGSSVEETLELAAPAESSLSALRRLDIESWLSRMNELMLAELGPIRSRCRSLVLLSNIHEDGATYVRSGPGRDAARQRPSRGR